MLVCKCMQTHTYIAHTYHIHVYMASCMHSLYVCVLYVCVCLGMHAYVYTPYNVKMHVPGYGGNNGMAGPIDACLLS
jgi:hypothetical protein